MEDGINSLAMKMQSHGISSAAKLPSDDRLLIMVKDPVDPQRPLLNSCTFYKGTDYLENFGAKTQADMDALPCWLQYNGNYHTKTGLWNAIKNPEGATTFDYKNREFRKITASCGLTTNRSTELFPNGSRVVKEADGRTVEKPNYKLNGDDQLYKTVSGERRRLVAYKDGVVNGEQAPDIMGRDKNGNTRGFSRYPGDHYEQRGPDDVVNDLGLSELWLKSAHHGYQTPDFIDREQGRDAAYYRFADYTGENRAHNKDTATAYVKVHDTYFPVKEVVAQFPDSSVAKAVQGEPTLDERLLLRMPTGNTFSPPSWVKATNATYFAKVCQEHGINPEWGDFDPKLTERLNKQYGDSEVLVEVDGNLVEATSIELPVRKSIIDVYHARQIFYESMTRSGERSGNMTSLAEAERRSKAPNGLGLENAMSKEAGALLTRVEGLPAESVDFSKAQPPPRYDSREQRGGRA
jgi:hypothetical protein